MTCVTYYKVTYLDILVRSSVRPKSAHRAAYQQNAYKHIKPHELPIEIIPA